jgi:hypothetical protein
VLSVYRNIQINNIELIQTEMFVIWSSIIGEMFNAERIRELIGKVNPSNSQQINRWLQLLLTTLDDE